MDRQHIIDEIIRTAEANGGVPSGKDRFFAETGIHKNDWFGKFWARWGDALKEAGFEPNKMRGAYEEDWIIEKLISIIRELGRFPSAGDLRLKAAQEKDFPSHNVFSRIGKKSGLVSKTLEYCINKSGFEDILEMCKTALIPTRSGKDSLQQGQINCGYVYLRRKFMWYIHDQALCIEA